MSGFLGGFTEERTFARKTFLSSSGKPLKCDSSSSMVMMAGVVYEGIGMRILYAIFPKNQPIDRI